MVLPRRAGAAVTDAMSRLVRLRSGRQPYGGFSEAFHQSSPYESDTIELLKGDGRKVRNLLRRVGFAISRQGINGRISPGTHARPCKIALGGRGRVSGKSE